MMPPVYSDTISHYIIIFFYYFYRIYQISILINFNLIIILKKFKLSGFFIINYLYLQKYNGITSIKLLIICLNWRRFVFKRRFEITNK